MKILILVNHDLVIYNFRKELVQKLIDTNYEVIISSPYGPRIDKLISMGAQYKPIEIDRHGFNAFTEFKLLSEYKNLMKKTKPDIILSYTIKPNIYGSIAARSLRIPIVANITGLGNGLNEDGFKSFLLLKLYRHAFKTTNKVFFQNKSNYDYLAAKIDIKEKSEIIPGSGVNLKEFTLKNYPNNDRTNILYFGRIMESKGIIEYLEAIESLNKDLSKVTYTFVGFFEDKDIETKFKYYAMRNQNIVYYEHTEDIKPFIENANAIILPSHHEGMSNALLESAAIGRPLLASAIPGCQEIIDDGINGFLFRVKDVNSIINSIRKFIFLELDSKKEMGLKSREKVEKEFDRDLVVNKYIKSINIITGGKIYE